MGILRFGLVLLVTMTFTFASPHGSTSYRPFGRYSFMPHGRGSSHKSDLSRAPQCIPRFLPCSEIRLSFRREGEGGPRIAQEADLTEFLRHFAAGGFNMLEVIQLARDTAQFFKTQFGIDFTTLNADQYLYLGGSISGVAAFQPFMNDPILSNNRLTTVVRNDRVQYFNTPATFNGWRLFIEKDFVSQGTFSGTLPGGVFITFGTMVIRPCEGIPLKKCKNILRPNDPARPIFIIERRDSGFTKQPGGGIGVIDRAVINKDFGKGISIGIRKTRSEGNLILKTYIFPENGF